MKYNPKDAEAMPSERPIPDPLIREMARVDKATMGKARLIATHKGISVAELISELLKGPVDKAYAQMLRDLDAKGAK